MKIYELTWVEGTKIDSEIYSTQELATQAMNKIKDLFTAKYPNLYKYPGSIWEDLISETYMNIGRANSKNDFVHISIHIHEKDLDPIESNYY